MERMGFDKHQIDYMEKVLGITHVVLPAMAASQPPALPARVEPAPALPMEEHARMIALVPLEAAEFPLRGEAAELIEKMIRAMKLDPGDVVMAAWKYDPGVGLPDEIAEMVSRAGHRPVLVFGLAETERFAGRRVGGGEWFDLHGARSLSTFSPRELLASPDRKRLAWVHLQVVMREL